MIHRDRMLNKPDIYKHIAEVYFAPSRHRKRSIFHSRFVSRNLFKITIAVIICFAIVLTVAILRPTSLRKSRIALVLETNTTRINYNFNGVKKEAAVFDLQNINLVDFKALGFRVRKTNRRGNVNMRVEFISDFEETSEIYIKQIPFKWEKHEINLAEFKDISDWSRMRRLSFVLEEWNTQLKNGIVYIDDVYFLK